MFDCNLKPVFVVGGSTGIGLELAKVFSSRGANVYIFARNKDHLELAIQEIASKKIRADQKFDYRQMDVSQPDNVAAVMEETIAVSGAPAILLNCAGRAYPDYFENITNEQFYQTMSTNFFSIWYIIKIILPYMKKNGGKIVNISSMCGVMGVFGYTDYCASKHAIIGFSEALRSEIKRYKIDVSVVCPPDTDTPGFHKENETKPRETVEISKGAKLMQPSEVAAEIIKGIDKGKELIIPGSDGRTLVLLKRLFPALLEKIMDSSIEKAQKCNT